MFYTCLAYTSCMHTSTLIYINVVLLHEVSHTFSAQAARFGEEDVRPQFPLERIHITCDIDSSRVIVTKPFMRIR